MTEDLSESGAAGLFLPETDRAALWRQVTSVIDSYVAGVAELPAAPDLSPESVAALREGLARWDFDGPAAPADALGYAARCLTRWQVHTPHPRYWGLFNPAPSTMGVAADALVAAFNPQLAAWSHSPWANEVEAHLVRAFADKFGFDPGGADGTFCSGGAEANHTALLCALTDRFPGFRDGGVRSLPADPVLYVSAEAHHSLAKAARLCGLGGAAARAIPAGSDLRLSPEAVAAAISEDRAAGKAPFLLCATAGTTSAGAIDPISELADLARREGLWLHVDAAWGGAAALVPELRPLLDGVERADSLTFDAHKWLSVPMGAGLFLTPHREILSGAFGVDTAYMPREGADVKGADPFSHTMQWSRRFTGLKLFLTLAVAGWDGYAAVLRHMVRVGDRLRNGLVGDGWRLANDTPLPVVCVDDAALPPGDPAQGPRLRGVVDRVLASGEAWVSTTALHGGARPVLRACVTHFASTEADADALVGTLRIARKAVSG